MPTLTAHYGFSKPDRGQYNWDPLINGDLDSIDTLLFGIGQGFTSVVAKTGSYTVVSGDKGTVFTFNGVSLTATLPSVAPSQPWLIAIINLNSTSLTINPNGLTLNGSASSITIAQNVVAFIWSDGSNYEYGTGGTGGGGGGAPGPFVGPSPWYDATNSTYGHLVARQVPQQTTTATTTASSPNVTLAGAIDFVNGDGIVIWKAGAATTQSTPAAPTVTAPVVQGSRTINYKCVGYDSMGGLTAASAAGSVTVAPQCMGNLPVTISSINQASGTVTVVTGTAINGLVNGKVNIFGTTGIAGANGLQTIATISGTTFTFSLAGNAGAGGVTGATAQLTNSFKITAMSRSLTTISVTTDQAHGIQPSSAGTGQVSLCRIDQNQPYTEDFIGIYLALTASGTSLTLDAAISSTETSTALGALQIWEYLLVTCPALAGTTKGYYIYADYANTGSYVLVGKTVGGAIVFQDYGPYHNGNFVAPAYVPTTPPGAAQNQLFVSTISSGGGTVNLVLAANVTSTVSAQTALHDDGIILQTISNLNSETKTILLPPTSNPGTTKGYIINSPITLMGETVVFVGGLITINETLTLGSGCKLLGGFFQGAGATVLQFNASPTTAMNGYASPMVAANFACVFTNLQWDMTGGNGRIGLVALQSVSGGYAESCAFTCGNLSQNIGASINSNNWTFIDCLYTGSYGNGGGQTIGQGLNYVFGPPIPTLSVGGNEFRNLRSNFFGRGMLFIGARALIEIYEMQAPSSPAVWTIASSAVGATSMEIFGTINDSLSSPVYANWGVAGQTRGIRIKGVNTSPATYPIVTGTTVAGLVFENMEPPAQFAGQNIQIKEDIVNQANNGVGYRAGQAVSRQAFPLLMFGGDNPSFGWPLPPPTAGLTATASGVGTWGAGTYHNAFSVTSVDWHNAESAPSPFFPDVTVNGSQGIQFSWTAVPGAKGYRIYDSNVFQQEVDNATTITIPNFFGNGSIQPAIGVSAYPVMDNAQVCTPILRLPGGNFKVDLSSVSGLTANRGVSYPDLGGTACISNGPVSLTAQAAAIAATTLLAIPAGDTGVYRISWVASITQAATTSCTLGGTNGFQITYTDSDDSNVKTSPASQTSSVNSVATQISGVIVVHAKAGTNIQYQIGYTSSGATAMQYNLYVKIEAM